MQQNEIFLYKLTQAENIQEDCIASDNEINSAIEQLFYGSKYDVENYGTSNWNPLSSFIRPGQNVLIKPNMVLEKSHQKGENYLSVVTNPQIIKTIVGYVYKALDGKGKITIGDAPINSADFNQLCINMGLYELQEEYTRKNFKIDLVDFRLYIMHKEENGIITELKNSFQKSDYVEIKVDANSTLKEIDHKFRKFRVTEYDPKTMPTKHNETLHRYCFHKVVLETDVVISLPKIKTHRKAGMTCAMKNFVGLNGNKDYLPHHTLYSVKEGGDEYLYPSFRKRMTSKLWEIRWKSKSKIKQKAIKHLELLISRTSKIIQYKDNYFEGSWWGNQTISRTVCDLNRAILYSDVNGSFQDKVQRQVLYLVDGIVCGEKEGPMQATSKICNLLVWGQNAYAVDLLVAQMMGFDSEKMHTLKIVPTIKKNPISLFNKNDVKVYSNLFNDCLPVNKIRDYIKYNFIPTSGWQGHIELENE